MPKSELTAAAPVLVWTIARDTQPREVAGRYSSGEVATLATINDPDGTGPIGWQASGAVLRWARAVEIQTDASVSDAVARQAAARYRRVLVIHCDAQHTDAWRLAAVMAGVKRFLPLAEPVSSRRRKGGVQ